MEIRSVVSSFLIHKGMLLIMKRSEKVGAHKGFWGIVSGHLEKQDSKPLDRAIIEIKEETGITGLELIKQGKRYQLYEKNLGIKWIIYPFLFKVNTDKVKIDWEHTEFKWINPEDISKYRTPPLLKEVFDSLK